MSKYTASQKIAYYKKLAKSRNNYAYGHGDYNYSKKKKYIAKPKVTKKAPARKKTNSFLPKAPESIGSSIGSWIGHGAQQLVKLVTGFGDYRIQRNSLMPGALEPPLIVNEKPFYGGVLVRHREYIADVLATTTFTTTSYNINAGLLQTFPWFSEVALAFEQYCVHGLIFEFKTMSSDTVLSTSTNTALGRMD